MDQIAEYGIAAHPLYKDGIADDRDRLAVESRAYAWLRQTVEQIAHGDAPEDFLEHTKLELFQDQVFCFTPKGRLIALPRGATPIDFAYAVHTESGTPASAPRSTASSRRSASRSRMATRWKSSARRFNGHPPPGRRSW